MSMQRDKLFNLNKITYVDYKLIEMDRVLTMLFPRLRYDGYASRRAPRKKELSIKDFILDFRKHDEKIVNAALKLQGDPSKYNHFLNTGIIKPDWFPELNQEELGLVAELGNDIKQDSTQTDIWFKGLLSGDNIEEVLSKWLETDLMDVVNRGKPNQAIAAPRPLHGNTYKFRNAKHSRDYGAAEQIYWMLYHARFGRGQAARDGLRKFFFPGIDLITDKYDPRVTVDVETQALLHLDQQVKGDRKDNKEPDRFPPLCIGQADLLAEDVLRLLAYQDHMPRSVLVEYLKTLFAFHLALYHLKLWKMLPVLINKRGLDTACVDGTCSVTATNFSNPMVACPNQIGLIVEMGDPTNKHMVELAERSADIHFRRIPEYIHSQFTITKLDEFAEYLSKINRLPMPAKGYFSVTELIQLLGQPMSSERENYFSSRLVNLIDSIGDEDGLPPDIKAITDLGLNRFDTFIEIIVKLRSTFHRTYITQCIDAFLLKNSEACLMRQSRAHGSPRYFSMGSKLLEVLLQIAVLVPKGNSYFTQDLRIDDLLSFLRNRYGLYIDRLPEFEGLGSSSILDHQALRKNMDAFKNRLREIGYFQDLSDAQLTQTVTSRYTITN